MSARKLNLEEIPANLVSLTKAPARQILIGASVYEICQLPHSEFAVFEKQLLGIAKEIGSTIQSLKSSVDETTGQVSAEVKNFDLLANSHIVGSISKHILDGVEPEDMVEATSAQVLYAVSMWLDLNLFIMPKETWQTFLRLFQAFA
jgi:hypothetical protein